MAHPRRSTAGLAPIAALLGGLIVGASSAWADEPALSPAQALLYDRSYLSEFAEPGALRYQFTRSTADGGGFEDQIRLIIKDVQPDGSRLISNQFFTGKRRRPYPDMDGFHGNPLVILFLQYDVWGMSRVLGGNPSYFRNRIKQSLAGGAEVRDTVIRRDGQELAAKQVIIRPFAGDRMAEQLREFQNKLYEITVSDQIPGGIYRIRAMVPAVDDAKGSMIEEIVEFAAVEQG